MILAVTFVALLLGSVVVVASVIHSKNRTYFNAVVGIYTDLVLYNCELNDIPIDSEHIDEAIRYGNYICEWYGVDYAYMYVPDIENGTITYVCATTRQNNRNKEFFSDNFIGKTVDYTLKKSEMAVWNGEIGIAYMRNNNEVGDELATVMCIEDSYGNRVMAGVDYPEEKIVAQIFAVLVIFGVFLIVVLITIYISVYFVIRKKVSTPAKLISKSMHEFITDGERNKTKLSINSHDEFSMIADAFNSMTGNIDNYLESIQTLTRDKVQQKTQLDIASRIQRGFLPNESFKMVNYNISATMKPAKNVGGDLYDYIKLDSHRTLLVIADVSGKGIAASIYMAVTMMLIRQHAKLGLSPCEILKSTNNVLSENNAALLFATAFVGIYDSSTGILTCSNAGHNLPYVVSDKVKKLELPSCTVLGFFNNEEYEECEIKLEKDDILYLYTDGVTESVNENREFYSEKRLEKALCEFKKSGSDNIVAHIEKSIADFSGEAEQYDDITMLTLTVSGGIDMSVSPVFSEFSKIKNEIISLELPHSQKMSLCLAAEEWFVNICSYAFEGMNAENEKVRFSLTLDDSLKMRFEHGGMEFNPLEETVEIDEYDIDTRIGGLGNFIAFASVDEVKYEYKDKKNILTFIQYIKEDNQ